MLAIVGGSGRLPDLLADARPEALRFVPEGVRFGCGAMSARRFRIERLGGLHAAMREAGVGQVVFAGAMRRPTIDPDALDDVTRQAMASLGPSLRRGDDALLRAVIAVFETAGLDVIGADRILPDLLPAPGVPTARRPDPAAAADAERGFALLDALSSVDIGQGCVVAGGQVLAIEAGPGTDWMLGTLAGEVPGRPMEAGVLCKRPKRGQDRRIDLPAIGPETVRMASRARLGGVVVEAGGVLVIDPDETIAAADREGLFLWIREA